MFGFAELVQSLFSQFATHTRHLEAAKWPGVVIRQGIVNPQGASFDFLEEALGLERVMCVEVRAQAIFAIVGQSDSLIKTTVSHDGNSRAKGLLAHNRHRMIDVGHDRWFIIIAALELRWASATSQHLRALRPGS